MKCLCIFMEFPDRQSDRWKSLVRSSERLENNRSTSTLGIRWKEVTNAGIKYLYFYSTYISNKIHWLIRCQTNCRYIIKQIWYSTTHKYVNNTRQNSQEKQLNREAQYMYRPAEMGMIFKIRSGVFNQPILSDLEQESESGSRRLEN